MNSEKISLWEFMQCMALFFDGSFYSLEEIQQFTGLPEKDCERILKAIAALQNDEVEWDH